MVRRKAPAHAAPSTIEEAVAAIADYLTYEDALTTLRADADRAIAEIEAQRDAFAAPLEADLRELFVALRTWWAVAGPQLTEGKRKSIELAGAQIGARTAPPHLKLPKGMKADEAVDLIERLGLDQVCDALRVRRTLDKSALIKMMTAPKPGAPANDLAAVGFTVEQREEFFIDRARDRDADPDMVDPGEIAVTEARS